MRGCFCLQLAGVMTISLVQCLNTFLRDCEFEFIVH